MDPSLSMHPGTTDHQHPTIFYTPQIYDHDPHKGKGESKAIQEPQVSPPPFSTNLGTVALRAPNSLVALDAQTNHHDDPTTMYSDFSKWPWRSNVLERSSIEEKIN
ncbi:hypothetical protein V5O48_011324, partial [Marasmius crinis-equi]